MNPRRTVWTAVVAAILMAPMNAVAAPADGPRSPGGAALWSIGATVVPIAGGAALIAASDEGVPGSMLVFGGLVLGPAAGYWYGDRETRGWQGVAMRGLIIGATIAASAGADELGDLGPAVAGVTLASGFALWDIALVARHVSVRNREAGYGAALTPYRDASGAPGVAVTVRF